MAPALLWRCLAAMKGISNLHSILIFPSPILLAAHFNGEEANPTKEAVLENSGFLNGLVMKDAMEVAINKLTELGIGTKKVNYRMRDAAFSRQRYWGEPFPITWKDNVAKEWKGDLPLELPHVETYSPAQMHKAH